MKKLILIILMLICVTSYSQNWSEVAKQAKEATYKEFKGSPFLRFYSVPNFSDHQAWIEKVITYDSARIFDYVDSIVIVYLPRKQQFRTAKKKEYYISMDISRQEYRVINSDKKVIAVFYKPEDAGEYIRFKERK